MGDAILLPGHHVVMFDKWIDSDAYYAYQEQGTGIVYSVTVYNREAGGERGTFVSHMYS